MFWHKMTARIEQLLMNPPPGSALETARDFGIDLSLLRERLRLTPEERLRDLQRVMSALKRMREQAGLEGKMINDCRAIADLE